MVLLDGVTVTVKAAHVRLMPIDIHRTGDEATWWKRAAIDPIETARAL